MRYFEDQDQLESFLQRFVTGWQVALHGAVDGSAAGDSEGSPNEAQR